MPTEQPLADVIQTYWKKALLAEVITRRDVELSTMLEAEALMPILCVACDETAAQRCAECGEHFCVACFGGTAAVEAGGACPWCAPARARPRHWPRAWRRSFAAAPRSPRHGKCSGTARSALGLARIPRQHALDRRVSPAPAPFGPDPLML